VFGAAATEALSVEALLFLGFEVDAGMGEAYRDVQLAVEGSVKLAAERLQMSLA
jgi:hypothetical protein